MVGGGDLVWTNASLQGSLKSSKSDMLLGRPVTYSSILLHITIVTALAAQGPEDRRADRATPAPIVLWRAASGRLALQRARKGVGRAWRRDQYRPGHHLPRQSLTVVINRVSR